MKKVIKKKKVVREKLATVKQIEKVNKTIRDLEKRIFKKKQVWTPVTQEITLEEKINLLAEHLKVSFSLRLEQEAKPELMVW